MCTDQGDQQCDTHVADSIRDRALDNMRPHQRRVLTATTAAATRARRAKLARFANYAAAAAFSAIFATLAVIVWAIDRTDGKQHKLSGVPIFAWCIAAALVFPVVAVAVLAVGAAAFLLEHALARVFDNAEYVLAGLRRGSQILVAAVTFNAVMDVLIARTGPTSSAATAPTKATSVLQKLTICLVIFAAVELVRSLAARLMSLRVHSGERLQQVQACHRLCGVCCAAAGCSEPALRCCTTYLMVWVGAVDAFLMHSMHCCCVPSTIVCTTLMLPLAHAA